MGIRKSIFICPDFDCYAATLRPRQSGRGMDYYRSCSSGSGTVLAIGLLSFHSALSLAKKHIAPIVAYFPSSTLHRWGSGKGFIESVPKNLESSARSLGERLKSLQR